MNTLFLSLSLLSCTGANENPGGYNINKLYPKLVSSTNEIDFGDVVVLYDHTETFQLINGGRADLEITGITVNGNEDTVYRTSTWLVDTNDTGTQDNMIEKTEFSEEDPLIIEPNESQTLEILFTPTTYLPYNRTLSIQSNDPEQSTTEIPLTGEGIDGPVPNISITPQALDFGEVSQGETETKYFEIRNSGTGVLEISNIEIEGSADFSVVTGLGGATFAQDQFSTVIVTYTPSEEGGANGTMALTTNDPDEEETVITFLGNGGGDFAYPIAGINCPSEVDPPTTITFDGRSSSDPNGYEPLIYHWSVANKPLASSTDFDTQGFESATFFVDAAGQYTVELVVENSVGLFSEPAPCTFTAIPDEAIQVELSWNTGNSDLDLHFVQYQGQDGPGELYESTFGFPIYHLDYDCCWCNANPPWGESGNQDDPSLSLDNRVGFGPEVTHITSPVNGTYGIFVHYFDDKGGGLTTATLKVFLDGVEITSEARPLQDKDYWYVGDVQWLNGVGTFYQSNENPAAISGLSTICYVPED
ncbi:MAG: hypothetical protein CMK59_02025 [Proteobacteria bacterium]|nr:hypothetical protein [Pseudomonadota bacterium]